MINMPILYYLFFTLFFNSAGFDWRRWWERSKGGHRSCGNTWSSRPCYWIDPWGWTTWRRRPWSNWAYWRGNYMRHVPLQCACQVEMKVREVIMSAKLITLRCVCSLIICKIRAVTYILENFPKTLMIPGGRTWDWDSVTFCYADISEVKQFR